MERICFNENWKVWKDLDPFELVFHVPEDAVSVDLPYDAMFHEEQKQGAVNGGYTGSIDAGEYKYYKKDIELMDKHKGIYTDLNFTRFYKDAKKVLDKQEISYYPF